MKENKLQKSKSINNISRVDKKLADELGFIMAEDIMAEKLKKPSFWDNFDMENFSAKQLKDLPGPDEKFR